MGAAKEYAKVAAQEGAALAKGGATYGGVQAGYLEEDFFGGRAKILTDQQFEALEMCGCEMKNRYKVGVPDQHGKLAEGSDFLYMHEESNCLERLCCSVNRELTLFLRQGPLPGAKSFYDQQPLQMAMHKPFHLQYCCCCRPSFDVTSADGSSLGAVTMPFKCCIIQQSVYRTGEEHPAFQVGPVPFCQKAVICPCCADLTVPVFKDGAEVAQFTHHKFTCCELLGQMNRMSVDFGGVQEPKDRALLFASMMLLELEIFEYNKNNNK